VVVVHHLRAEQSVEVDVGDVGREDKKPDILRVQDAERELLDVGAVAHIDAAEERELTLRQVVSTPRMASLLLTFTGTPTSPLGSVSMSSPATSLSVQGAGAAA